MYTCKKHGELDNEWCGECNDTISCDCSDMIITRFKDLIYDCKEGERTVTIYIEHCETCGIISCVR